MQSDAAGIDNMQAMASWYALQTVLSAQMPAAIAITGLRQRGWWAQLLTTGQGYKESATGKHGLETGLGTGY
jgi:beta-lactamase superfamily II metal-dependent hydrolase